MRAIFVLSDKRDVVGHWTSRTNTNYYSHMRNRKMLSILGMMFILCSVISCKGDDKPGTGVNPADRDTAPGEPISIVDGKVRFYIDIDTDAARVKAGVAASDLLSAASSVYVNGTKYDVASDESGNLYIDALAKELILLLLLSKMGPGGSELLRPSTLRFLQASSPLTER